MSQAIETIRPGDEARGHELSRQAFGGTDAFDPDAPPVGADRVVAAYDGDRLAGKVLTWGFAQTWGGRPVPCGGVGGVLVAPEDRGRGLARMMLAESLDRMAERGEVVSALYPTTATLYRSMGYEIVGSWANRRIDLADVPADPAAALSWERVAFEDPRLPELVDTHAGLRDGWIRLDPVFWAGRVRSWGRDDRKNRFAYIGRSGDDAVVGLVFSHVSGAELPAMYDLAVEVVAVVDESWMPAALGFLAGHSTTAGRLRTTLPGSVLALQVPHAQRVRVEHEWPWMLRIVDATGAVAARGCPVGVSGAAALTIHDPVREHNAGTFVLEVGGGSMRLHPAQSSSAARAVDVSIGELAVVYAGGTDSLVAGGRLRPGETTDLLRSAFVSTPTLPVFF